MSILDLYLQNQKAKLSFHNNRTFLQKIDALPTGPDWTCEIVTAAGDQVDENGELMVEELELWMRDPERVYGNAEGTEDSRIFDEMWTANWWWKIQVRSPGACVSGIIISSDKTKLSQFQGDKTAWPVYLTIGNISALPTKHDLWQATASSITACPFS